MSIHTALALFWFIKSWVCAALTGRDEKKNRSWSQKSESWRKLNHKSWTRLDAIKMLFYGRYLKPQRKLISTLNWPSNDDEFFFWLLFLQKSTRERSRSWSWSIRNDIGAERLTKISFSSDHQHDCVIKRTFFCWTFSLDSTLKMNWTIIVQLQTLYKNFIPFFCGDSWIAGGSHNLWSRVIRCVIRRTSRRFPRYSSSHAMLWSIFFIINFIRCYSFCFWLPKDFLWFPVCSTF